MNEIPETQYFHLYKSIMNGIRETQYLFGKTAHNILLVCFMNNWETFPSIISVNIFSGRGRVMRVKPGEKYVTGSCFNKTSKKNIMIFYTKLKPIRTGWSWSSGSEDLETGVSLRGPVLDFSREIKMPSFEVLASFVFIRLKFLSQLKASSPLTGGLGARMMEKMGWKDGEGLGKDRWEANILKRGRVKYKVIKVRSRGGWGAEVPKSIQTYFFQNIQKCLETYNTWGGIISDPSLKLWCPKDCSTLHSLRGHFLGLCSLQWVGVQSQTNKCAHIFGVTKRMFFVA